MAGFRPVISPANCCPVQIPVGGLDQPPKGLGAVRTIATTLRAEVVKCGQFAAGSDFEDRATANPPAKAEISTAGPALNRYPVQVPVNGLDQPHRVEIGAVRAIATALRAKSVDGREDSIRRHLECSARAVGAGATFECRSVEVSIAGLYQRGFGNGPVCRVELVQRGQDAVRGNLEDCATASS